MKILRIISAAVFLPACLLLAGCPSLFGNGDPSSPNSDKLIFKLVNQWGIGGRDSWENVQDGALWITADAMKAEGAIVMFMDNLRDYNPSLIATFRIDHPKRSDLRIGFSLGDPRYDQEVSYKSFLPSEIYRGNGGYSNELIACDLSEWFEGAKTKKVLMSVWDDSAQTTTGKICSFQLEIYDDYNTAPAVTLSASGSFPLSTINGQTVYATIDTIGKIPSAAAHDHSTELSKNLRSLFPARLLRDSEYKELRDKIGVKEEGRDYNPTVKGHGTGLAPPDEEEWERIRKSAMTLDFGVRETSATVLPDFVDLSADKSFPPIGDQGQLGSCAAFSVAYYMKTYMEASERGWNLSTDSSDKWKKIMSPSFAYALANDGRNSGLDRSDVIGIISTIGCASWQTMPYSDTYIDPIPSESSWREAPMYRGRIPEYSEHACWYCLYIRSDEDIKILKELLAAGIPLSIAVDANQYSKLDGQDIWDIDNYHDARENHANTIVGYKMPISP